MEKGRKEHWKHQIDWEKAWKEERRTQLKVLELQKVSLKESLQKEKMKEPRDGMEEELMECQRYALYYEVQRVRQWGSKA